MMKLLFVHQHLGAHGGAEANVLLTAKELRQRGHVLALLHGEATGVSEEAWRSTFSQCTRLDDFHPAQSTRLVLQRFQPDIIYLHRMGELKVVEALLESKIPLVRMVHDHELYCMRSYKYNYFTRQTCTRPTSFYCVWPCLGFLARNRSGRLPVKFLSYRRKKRELRLNRNCNRLVVYSDYARQELVRNGFAPDKIEIHVPIRTWGANGEVSSFSDRNLILYAGQIIRGKGVDVLLRILQKVTSPFEAVILGDGNYRSYCEELCTRLGLDQRVHFHGFILREELKRFYLETSVFVVSSVWPEPFGLVGPEAMRYGLPVVAFDAGGIREWLLDGFNGFLVPWMNIDLFAARVDQLLQDKKLAREMGRRGLERVNAEYAASRQIDGLEAMFERVLGEGRVGARACTSPVYQGSE